MLGTGRRRLSRRRRSHRSPVGPAGPPRPAPAPAAPQDLNPFAPRRYTPRSQARRAPRIASDEDVQQFGDFKNLDFLSRFVTDAGRLKGRHDTRLRPSVHYRLMKQVRAAAAAPAVAGAAAAGAGAGAVAAAAAVARPGPRLVQLHAARGLCAARAQPTAAVQAPSSQLPTGAAAAQIKLARIMALMPHEARQEDKARQRLRSFNAAAAAHKLPESSA